MKRAFVSSLKAKHQVWPRLDLHFQLLMRVPYSIWPHGSVAIVVIGREAG